MKTQSARKFAGLSLPIVFLLVSTVMIAGCTGQSNTDTGSTKDVNVIGGSTEDTTITAKVPEFARKDTDFNWQLIVQPSSAIKDFRAEIYDAGLFQGGDSAENMNLYEAEIMANRTKAFSLRYRMGDPGLAEKTDIKIRSFYSSETSIATTVAALSETEYFHRKATGTLDAIPVATTTTNNPLRLSISWSDAMPLLDKQEVQMYVDYKNNGEGYITTLEKNSVVFNIPSNLQAVRCDDYTLSTIAQPGGTMTLSKTLDFVQKSAKRSTCTFAVKAAGTIDSQSISGRASYLYETDSTVSVPIIQR